MKQERKNIFETNSSSTHCVVVSKENNADPTEKYYMWCYDSFCYGRCESQLVDSLASKIAYAYIVAKDLSEWNRLNKPDGYKEFLKNLYEVSEKYFIKKPEDSYEEHEGFTLSNLKHFISKLDKMIEKYEAYVDHVEDYVDNGFFDKLISDKDFIERLIFDEDSYITIGGDEYRGYNLKTIGFEHDYEYSYKKGVSHEMDEDGYFKYIDPMDYYTGQFWRKVKKYREKFEVFFKGN